MNKQYEPVRDIWEFEQYLASKPDVWMNQAHNLRNSVNVLCSYNDEAQKQAFQEHEQNRLTIFWSAGVIRMLMGFSLENLIKAILLKDPEKLKEVFGRKGRLSWGKDGHDLLKLFQEASLITTDADQKYLELWRLCALWAGRYPLPAHEKDLPQQRKALPSREALLRRSRKRIDAAMKSGDSLMGVEIQDLLHTGVGATEIDIFRNLFNKCLTQLIKNESEN